MDVTQHRRQSQVHILLWHWVCATTQSVPCTQLQTAQTLSQGKALCLTTYSQQLGFPEVQNHTAWAPLPHPIPSPCSPPALSPHQLVLLLHLSELLAVLLVHLFQLCHHSLTLLAQHLLVIYELRRVKKESGNQAGRSQSHIWLQKQQAEVGWYYLVDEGQMSLDSCLVLLPLQLELVAKLLLSLLDVPDSKLPLLSLLYREERTTRHERE